MAQQLFDVRNPFGGWSLLVRFLELILLMVFSAFIFWAALNSGYAFAYVSLSILSVVLLSLYFFNLLALRQFKYVITDSTVELRPRSIWFNALPPIPIDTITRIEVLDPPKNIIETFIPFAWQRLRQRGLWPYSMATTKAFTGLVLIITNKRRAGSGLFETYCITPKDNEKFINALRGKLKASSR